MIERYAQLDAGKLEVTQAKQVAPVPPLDQLEFGKTMTDHMLQVKWTASKGWHTPEIKPYENISLNPSACVLHYGFECFEGMKAYKDADGNLRLFRPQKNLARLNDSATSIMLPSFDSDEMLKLIAEFVSLEERYVPNARGYSLYLRPTLIGVNGGLGVSPPSEALFFLIGSPVGTYHSKSPQAVSVDTVSSSKAVRAWPGGLGNKKVGANYAPCLVHETDARRRGYNQILWLFGDDDHLSEVGTMNIFVVFHHRDRYCYELATPRLGGTILPGITRDSALALAREKLEPKGWIVSERDIPMAEVQAASARGDLAEVFGTGTAAIVCPVRNIGWKGQEVSCGLAEGQGSGPLASQMKDWIEGRQYGEEEHEWSVRVDEILDRSD